MTDREAISNVLHYKDTDRIPVLHFGFWVETLQKWVNEGHLLQSEINELLMKGNMADGNKYEREIAKKLGFDDNALVYTGQKGNWYDVPLYPTFPESVIERYQDGSYKKRDCDGVYVLAKDNTQSIPAEIDHTLKDRESFEKEYLPRLRWTKDRLDMNAIQNLIEQNKTRNRHMCIYAGSLFGKMRNYWGLVEVSYLLVDDEELYKECVDTIAETSYQIVKNTLETGVSVDFVHFWEDICYNKGSLINPNVFRTYFGKHYRRIADLCNQYGIDIVSVDCDGMIEDLVPIWLDNGVNTMFPVEYGAWQYDFSRMRNKFGTTLRGIGNVNKHILAQSKKAIDMEIERVKRIVDLGGYVPCLDHRIAPDAEWDLVKYYCEKMREAFTW